MSHDIFFDEQSHVYLVDGTATPSVTDILTPLHRSYGAISPAILEYAANRGTAVHEAAELIDMGAEPEVSFEIAGYIKAYIDFLNVYRPAWIEIESIVYNEADGYIGTLDRLGYFNGDDKLNLVDIKTSAATRESITSACLQTYAYAKAYDPQADIERWVLFLKPDGAWSLRSCADYAKKNGFVTSECWQTLLKARKMVDALLTTGGKK